MAELTDSDWQERARAAEARADDAWQQYHRLAAEVETYKQDSKRLKQLEDSISWKITAPLRIVSWTYRAFKQQLPKLIARWRVQH